MFRSLIIVAALLSSIWASADAFDFRPDSTTGNYKSDVPVLYDITKTQFEDNEASGNYWLASYVHASNGRDYALMSNTFAITSTFVVYRSLILDLANITNFNQALVYGTTTTTLGSSSMFGIETVSSYNSSPVKGGFASLTADNVSSIRTYSYHPKVTFDYTFNATTPVLYNGGMGIFQYDTFTTKQWSLPGAATSGTLTVNGKNLTIDSAKSLTWYDRQLNFGQYPGFVLWCGFSIGNGNEKLKISLWVLRPTSGSEKRLATVRRANGDHATVTFDISGGNRTFTSSKTNTTYTVDWVVTRGTEKLFISSYKEDQFFYGQGTGLNIYSGFFTTKGIFYGVGAQGGFGFMEM